MEITFQIKGLFFDRDGVKRKMDAASRRNLSKAGAFIRRRARSSVRFRKASSTPGMPPSAHTKREPNLRTILFAYEPLRKSVVVGPVRFNSPTVVPQVLEHGGTVTIRRKSDRANRVRKVAIAPRPFMGPATATEAPKFPDLWAGSVRQ